MIGYVKVGAFLSDIGRCMVNRLCWLAVVSAAFFSASCGSKSDDVSLPLLTDFSESPPPSSPVVEERAVAAAYMEFVAMLDRADSLPSESRKHDLATVMVDPQLSRVLRRVEEMKRQHIATYGQVAVRIKSVQLTSSGATVFDCQDSSGAGILHSITGKKINRGVREGNTKALLVKGADGRWRVRKSITIGEGC